jgi:hypothetical protein
MANEYPNSGILFSNDNKRTDKHPDWRGDGEITCVHCGSIIELWLSAWSKRGRKGEYLTASFKAKDPARFPAEDNR